MKVNIGRRLSRSILGGVLVAGVAATTLALSTSAATAADHQVLGWGNNGTWQLGDSSDRGNYPRPVPIVGLTGMEITDLAAGGDGDGYGLGLALLSNGTVAAWGYNGNGQLGDGSLDWRTRPVRVTDLTDVVAISAGGNHNLALRSDGTVWAWGYNGNGRLGNPNAGGQSTTPVQVSDLAGVVAISAGTSHSLAITDDGHVWAWGFNGSSQLGNPNAGGQSTTPVQVSGIEDVRSVAAGHNHSLAVLTNGNVMAWGYNGNGEMGDGSTNSPHPVPGLVKDPSGTTNLSGITEVDTTEAGSVALGSDGTVYTWGDNANGELGEGGDAGGQRNLPGSVDGLSDIVDIAAGKRHIVALGSNGTVYGWGWNGFGQVGNGKPGQDQSSPVEALDRDSDLTRVAAPVHANFSYAG